jgi:thioredoxin reductase
MRIRCVTSPVTLVFEMSDDLRDVVIVGGGPAGLSAALVLGRARRRVLVVDAGRPANRVSRAIGGLLGHDDSPAALRARGRRQLAKLPTVEVVDGEALDAKSDGDSFSVAIARDDGVENVRARALLLANGLHYETPQIDGLDALWGRSVFHCVFCDGFEVSDRPIALHANGRSAARLALLTAGWSDDVVLCTDGPADLSLGDYAELRGAGVRIREERIARLESRRGQLKQIVFESGGPEAREALFVRPRRTQPTEIAERLGLELNDSELIEADDGGRTAVPGVYVAGDASAAVRSVAIAIGSGSRVATAMVADLIVDRLSVRV